MKLLVKIEKNYISYLESKLIVLVFSDPVSFIDELALILGAQLKVKHCNTVVHFQPEKQQLHTMSFNNEL